MALSEQTGTGMQATLDVGRLIAVLTQIHGCRSIRDLILNQTPQLMELFDVERVTVYAVDEHTSQLFSLFKRGSDVNEIRLPISHSSLAGHCARSAQTLAISDAYDAQELQAYHPQLRFDSRWDAKSGFVTRQVLVTPIFFEGSVIGVLQLVNRRAGETFDEQACSAAAQIAQTLGVALYNQRRLGRSGQTNQFGYLLDLGLLTQDQMNEAISYARLNATPITTVLIDKCGVSKTAVLTSLAQYYNTDYFSFDGTMVMAQELQDRLSYEQLSKLGVAVLEKHGGFLRIAVEDPSDLEKLDLVRHMDLGAEHQYLVALPEDIESYLASSFGMSRSTAPDWTEEILADLQVHTQERDETTEAEADEADSTIVRMAYGIIKDAVAQGASDIHIEPNGVGRSTQIRFRVDGVCHVYQEIPASHRKALVSRLKIMAKLDIAEKRKPQDGKIRLRMESEVVELRVATVPTTGGEEDIVLRLLASSSSLSLAELGFTDRNLGHLRHMVESPYGIILCVGPTGSGKTTTLHSLIGHINTPERKIWTAEDPVEITQLGLRQVEVKPKIGFTFATAMRAFLRADPDVIMVGEMRDHETAAIGIEASLTGHLVLSTLHTNSAPETVTRLLDMDIDPCNFADALLGILAQRLVRALCPVCKEAYFPSRSELVTLRELYGEVAFATLGVELNRELRLFRPVGCDKCGRTGYKGRLGVHELLVASEHIKSLMLKRSDAGEIREAAAREGMTTLLQDGIAKVLQGHTDLKQVQAVCMR